MPLQLGKRIGNWTISGYLANRAYAEVLRVLILVMDVLHEVFQSSLPQLVDWPAAQDWLHTLVE